MELSCNVKMLNKELELESRELNCPGGRLDNIERDLDTTSSIQKERLKELRQLTKAGKRPETPLTLTRYPQEVLTCLLYLPSPHGN